MFLRSGSKHQIVSNFLSYQFLNFIMYSPQDESLQPKKRPRVAKSHALVPTPDVEELPGWYWKPSKKRSDKKDEQRFARAVDKNLEGWSSLAPTFKLDVDWKDLSPRPKNTVAELAAAQATMDEMRTWEADACSGRWTDRHGKPLLAYFADLIQPVSRFK
jgi:hypothetical protein